MENVAVLITCFNRVNTTLTCLNSFYKMNITEGYQLDVYLVDDQSPDLTGEIVKEKYPQVNVIEGTGKLYWNGGMRLAWQTAIQTKDYDFYLWLNDDTVLFPHAFDTIINDYYQLKNDAIDSLVLGVFKDPVTKEITYSGRMHGEKLIPNGNPQECTYVTGNFVLVPKQIYKAIGMLDKHYSHGIGDTDYGYRTVKKGLKCHVTSKYVGYCKLNRKKKWHSKDFSFRERYKRLLSKTEGNFREYLRFKYVHFGIFAATMSMINCYTKLFFPPKERI